MSNFEAIRGVTWTLRRLLQDNLEVAPVTITLVPPDVTLAGLNGRRINLFLYLVEESPYLRNQEIPGEGSPGAYGYPPLSLSLHYLMTAYSEGDSSNERELPAQEALAAGMRVFHDFAILRQDNATLDPSLLGEFEQVKITLKPANLDEMSKVWSAMPSANYRCSAAYQVSIVQIESKSARRTAQPVATRRLHAAIMGHPAITAVYRTPALLSDPKGDIRAAVGQSLTIEGSGFLAPQTWVRLGGLDPIPVTPISDTLIRISVPDAFYPPVGANPPQPIPPGQQLQPGPQFVDVRVQRTGEGIQGGLDRGTTFSEPQVEVSNQSVFTLVPSVTAVTPNPASVAGLLTVAGTRLFQTGLKSYVFVSDVAIEIVEPGASDPWAPPTATSVQVPLTAVTAANPPLTIPNPYPVRVQNNGALSVDAPSVNFS
jgi:uncharacterized protein DUF4255